MLRSRLILFACSCGLYNTTDAVGREISVGKEQGLKEIFAHRQNGNQPDDVTVGALIPGGNRWNIQPFLSITKAREDLYVTYEVDIAYGFTPKVGIELDIPFFLVNKTDEGTNRGISDISLQLIWNISTDKLHQTTIRGGIQFPTGTIKTDPVLGTGSFNFVGEFFFNHDSKRWYFDTAFDWQVVTKRHSIHYGSEYDLFLTFGPVKKLKNSPSTLYFLASFHSLYITRDKIKGVVDPDSGSYGAFLGPYFSWERKNILLEATIVAPIGQSINGKQSKYDFIAQFYFQVSF